MKKPFYPKSLRFIILSMICLICQFIAYAQDFEERRPGELTGTFYSSSGFFTGHQERSENPYITQVLDLICPDSIKATMQHLQNYGTRFLMLDSRKEIADWLVQKFVSYGYLDVKIDSFQCYINWNNIYVDTNMQYNVVATLPGMSAPDEEYIIGGHYDSYCVVNPYIYAPGADDNASAVAATLEIARVMKEVNFLPEATIRFVPFAAEELGLFGSRHYAQQAREEGRDIRLVYNMDMISNNPDNLNEVTLYQYPYFEWATYLAADVMQVYTGLDVFLPEGINGGSDSFPFWLWGYPSVYAEERDFSPNWHQPSDTVGNCNIDYCAQITKGVFSLLLQEQFLPYPQGVYASSSEQGVTISWAPTQNANVAGFNVYRSQEQGTGYEKINSSLLTGTQYTDQAIPAGVDYYYVITVVNTSMEESLPSPEVHGARFNFSDTLLVVNTLAGYNSTPDSIFQYYDVILEGIPYHWQDLNEGQPLTLASLGLHRNVLWLANASGYSTGMAPSYSDMISFFTNGGHMMVSAFTPGKLIENVTTYPMAYPEGSLLHDYFKTDTVYHNLTSFMYQAYPVVDDYDTLRIDTHKQLVPNHAGEIFNVDLFTPSAEGSIIFRFDSHYDPNSAFGASQDEPVGIEYMGEDFKTLMLSFPLYYLDTTDARDFLHYVMVQKFNIPTGIMEDQKNQSENILSCFPNPLRNNTTLEFTLREEGAVNLSVYNIQGLPVTVLVNDRLTKGRHQINFDAGCLTAGIYQVVLRTATGLYARKIVKL
jgi:hypothetical protein